MKKIYILTLTCVFISFLSKSQINSWQQTATPPGGSVWGMATIGSNVFAGASNGGLYYSADNGATWIQRNANFSPTMAVRALAVSGTDLFAGINSGSGYGVYKTSDNGLNWINVTPSGMSPNTNVLSLVIDGNYIYAGTFGGQYGIYKSALNNISPASWSTFNNGLNSKDIKSLTFNGANIIAGAYGGGVYISPTASDNWVFSSGSQNTGITALCATGSVVLGGNISGGPVLYRSINNGAAWVADNNPIFSNKPIYAFIKNGTSIYAGTEGSGVFVSNDDGTTWLNYNLGFKDNLNNWFCNQINVRSFTIKDDTLYCGTDCGVWKAKADVEMQDLAPTGMTKMNFSSGFYIYPNPSNTRINVEFINLPSTEVRFEVANILGQKILESSFTEGNFSVDVSKWNKGIYFSKIVNKQGEIFGTKKIIVE